MIEIPNARLYDSNLLGGQPSEADIAAMARAGFEALIDLRLEGEPGAEDNRAIALAQGLRYIHIPVDDAKGLTRENALLLSQALAGQGPFAIICKSGNRVGALVALKEAWIDGLEASEAFENGVKAGMTRLAPDLRRVLGLDA